MNHPDICKKKKTEKINWISQGKRQQESNTHVSPAPIWNPWPEPPDHGVWVYFLLENKCFDSVNLVHYIWALNRKVVLNIIDFLSFYSNCILFPAKVLPLQLRASNFKSQDRPSLLRWPRNHEWPECWVSQPNAGRVP